MEKAIVMKLLFPGNGPIEGPPAIKLSDSSAGSVPTWFNVVPAKSSTVPNQPVSPTVPVPELALIEVGTEPEPGTAAVVIESELKLNAAINTAFAGRIPSNETELIEIRSVLIFIAV
jgi:hypothetical protein